MKRGFDNFTIRTKRTGCMETSCWCHVDQKEIGFECSTCGCKVVEIECRHEDSTERNGYAICLDCGRTEAL